MFPRTTDPLGETDWFPIQASLGTTASLGVADAGHFGGRGVLSQSYH